MLLMSCYVYLYLCVFLSLSLSISVLQISFSLSIYVYIYIHTCIYLIATYVHSTVGRYNTGYAKYTQYIDNYCTSFWSPVGSGWEFRTKFGNFYAWNYAPCLFYVFQQKVNTLHLKNKHWNGHYHKAACCSKTRKSVCGSPETPYMGLGDTSTY